MGGNLVEAPALLGGEAAGRLHGVRAYAALGRVDYPREAQVVGRGEDDGQVREHILYLRAVEEAHSADDAVGDAVALEGELEPVRLRVHAVEHGAVAEIAARAAAREDVRGDELGLVVLVHGRVERELFARARVRPEGLALAGGVVRNHGVRGGEDVARGAVVLLEAYRPAALVLLLEGEDVLYRRAAELVDALVVVADDADVPVPSGEEAREQVLEVVGVLILVNEYIFELPLIVLADVGVLLQEPHGVVQQVVEVHRPGGEEPRGVALVYLAELALPGVGALAVFGGVLLGAHEPVARAVDDGEHAARGIDLLVEVELAQHGLHDRELVGAVVDGEAPGVAEPVRVAAQYAHAGRVEGAGPDVLRGGAEHGLEAALELVGGLIREGDGEYAPGLHGLERGEAARLVRGPGLEHGEVRLRSARGKLVRVRRAAVAQQVCHAVDEDGGLPAACPGENEQRPLRGQHSLALHGVQLAEIVLNYPPPCGDVSLFEVVFHSGLFYHIKPP